MRGSEPLPSAAERRRHILSLVLRCKLVEAEGLRQPAEALRRQILELEQVRAQTTVDPPGTVPARFAAGRSVGAFWSPVPVLGFRMWTLSSLSARGAVRVWEEPSLVADCPRGPGSPHDSPGCRCGIYAFKDAGALWAVPGGAWPSNIYGLVALSGKVIEHEHGYRGQRAEVAAVALVRDGALVCRSDPEWIARLFVPGSGWAEAERAGGVRVGSRGMPVCAVEYLSDEARRFGQAWTSESRSG